MNDPEIQPAALALPVTAKLMTTLYSAGGAALCD